MFKNSLKTVQISMQYTIIVKYMLKSWIRKCTLSSPCTGFGRRSDSISYFRILKHSSLSSKNNAYVRTQAEQSQATYRTKMLKTCNLCPYELA